MPTLQAVLTTSSQTNKFMFDLPYDIMAIGKYVVILLHFFRRLTHKLTSHELYIYANTLDMYKNFMPKFNGRYLSSNVNITVADLHGNPVSITVGGKCPSLAISSKFPCKKRTQPEAIPLLQ